MYMYMYIRVCTTCTCIQHTHTHICVHVNRLQDTKARLTLDPLSESTAAKPSSAVRVETIARTTLADTCTCVHVYTHYMNMGGVVTVMF